MPQVRYVNDFAGSSKIVMWNMSQFGIKWRMAMRVAEGAQWHIPLERRPFCLATWIKRVCGFWFFIMWTYTVVVPCLGEEVSFEL